MSIDMTQFLVTFYEESFEGLEIMESELLNLDIGAADAETINTIFRAAHSIKGGSGTFGLNAVASYTHVMETLLDEMRNGKREVTQQAVAILLSSVDVLRDMLKSLRDDLPLDHDAVAASQQELDELLTGVEHGESPSSDSDLHHAEIEPELEPELEPESQMGWRICFTPHRDMLKTGNDPVRMIRELESMADIQVNVDMANLPSLDDLDAEESYLSWEIFMTDCISEIEVREVFAWVEDECDLSIEPYAGTVMEQSLDISVKSEPELNVELLEKSFNLVAPEGEKIVAQFYEQLFERFPQVKPLFANTTTEKQQVKLLAALKLVIGNLRNPETLIKTLTELGVRHQAYGIEAAHYEAVAETLLSVLQEFAGDAWTDDVKTAWSDALTIIATVMLDAYQADDEVIAVQQTAVQPAVSPVQKTASTLVEEKTAPALTTKPIDKKAAGEGRKPSTGSGTGETSIRVSIDKVDELINTVGELVITQSMLGQFGELEDLTNDHQDKLRDGLAQLERNTRELQESVMRIRMLPISFTFQRFPRLVHDLSNQLGKKVELKMSGEQTELDKTVMEKIGDPLVHLVRNSMDHGIESPAQRIAAGKPEMGTVNLNAFHQGGNIVIEINDDGGGLNAEKILAKAKSNGLIGDDETLTEEQIHDLLFQPGFSTADQVSDVSGRGVGMDVVRRNIRSLGGSVEVKSTEGVGSTFTIRLPLTLAILEGQLIRVGRETYVVPLVSIIESVQIHKEKVNVISGRGEVYKLRDDYIPIVRLYHVFGLKAESTTLDKGLLVIVETEGKKVAMFVDDLLGQQQVVIKSLETNFRKIDGLSGATILGDGTVALILDVAGLFDLSKKITTHTDFDKSDEPRDSEIDCDENKLKDSDDEAVA